jgi:cellulose synthase/poly-beta-1,6-N-acetylglucosamine synthase-like glycosyltransferase
MAILENDYEIAVVLDADNIMHRNFLGKINAAFDSLGNKVIAVQGHRTAKNQNTPLAILDAISEEINNHIFRKGHRALKLSSAIIGSGMAFRYGFFKALMLNVEAVGGFDKEIELKMLKEGYLIEYLDDALVYDEKVQKEEAFSNQRRRWLAAQFVYLRRDFLSAVRHLILNRNIDYFDKVIQFVQPPRILLLGAIVLSGTIFTVTNMMIENSGYGLYWASLMVLCLASLFLSIPFAFYNRKTFLALVYLPKGMFLMMKSLLQIKGANRQFIHTRHTIIAEDQGIK